MTTKRYGRRAARLPAAFVAVAAMTAATVTPVAAAAAPGTVGMGTAGPTGRAPASAPCFTNAVVCQSSNPDVTLGLVSVGDTSSCTFQGDFAWGDGAKVSFTFHGGSNGTRLVSKKHHYRVPGVYHGTWASKVITGSNCHSNSGTFQFTLECTTAELSGPAWASKFPGTKSLSDLSPAFRGKVTRFIAAMEHAGIKEKTLSTLRRRESAYLMHFSWLIAKHRQDPTAVPAFVPKNGQSPVDICWVHTKNGSVDLPASISAAQKMVRAFGIDPTLAVPPALDPRHVEGLAIDMTTTWTSATITIVDGAGHSVKISSKPHSGVNKQLIAVGKTYGVIHLKNAKGDKNHWSNDGH